MALVKRTYVDGETIITAQNLNDIQDEVIAHESNKVPITRTVNSKALSSNITLSASDVGAVPTTRTVNSKALSSNITLTAADVSAVPTTRTVNSKALSSNITLSASDVGAVPTTRTVNSKALSSNITLTSDDIGYNSSTTYTSGTVGKAVSDLNGAITSIENGIAIVANGNTHAAITKGQYVYIKGHGTLSDGLYTATAAIPLNGTLSSSNVAFVTDGGLNAIQTIIGHLNSIDALVITPSTNVYTNSFYFNYVGNAIVPTGYFNTTENLQNGANVMTVNKAPKDAQSILAVGLNSHLAYVLTYGPTGVITAPEGLPSGYYRMIATVILR